MSSSIAFQNTATRTERRVRGDQDTLLLAPRLQLERRQARVTLDLVRCGDDRSLAQKHLEQLHREVGYSDRAHLPGLEQCLHVAPRLDEGRTLVVRDGRVVLRVRLRPVHKVEVDVVDAELREGLLEGRVHLVVVLVWELRGEEDVRARDAGLADRFPDVLLVCVPVRLVGTVTNSDCMSKSGLPYQDACILPTGG